MEREFKILLLYKNPDDIALLKEELSSTKIRFDLKQVESRESYLKGLKEYGPDIILAETTHPELSGAEAMNLAQELSHQTSFILLSSFENDEEAASILKSEASEYFKKQRISKIKTTVKTILDIKNAAEGKVKADKALKKESRDELGKSISLLTATLESTADGILVVDNSGKMIKFNKKFVDMWHIPMAVMDSRDDNVALEFVLSQLKDPKGFLKKVRELYSDPYAESFDVLEFNDGRVFERYSKPQLIGGKNVGRVWSFRDVTERKQKDEELKASLKEKELMLGEIHHRVKNNLQIITSLLSMQSSYVKDAEAKEYLKISLNRVRSMAMIHDRLYGSKEITNIDFGDYIKKLTAHLFISYGATAKDVDLYIKADNVLFDIDTAMPCGLLINELVTNSLKHAFSRRALSKKAEINIELFFDKDSNEYNLTVQDNGVGIPEKIDYRNTSSLGLQLVSSLTGQLGGKIELSRESGTRFHIKFPPLVYTERISK